MISAKMVLKALKEHPEKWTFTETLAIYQNVILWIENRPYADLTICDFSKGYDFGEVRIGNFWNRRKIRKAMDKIRKSFNVSQSYIDTEVDKILQS